MRFGFGVVVLCVGLALGAVFAQENETKTTEKPEVLQPPVHPRVDADSMWRYHYEGVKGKGDFLELANPEDKVGKGRTLVITQIDVRMRQTMRARIMSHRKLARQRNGQDVWDKDVVRSDLFSLGWREASTQYMAWAYSGFVGLRFEAGTRPAIEFRQGRGDVAVYAEGYWVRKGP